MVMIKLTMVVGGTSVMAFTSKVNYKPLYLNPQHIVTMTSCAMVLNGKDIDGSSITMVTSECFWVTKSPEQILKLIDDGK